MSAARPRHRAAPVTLVFVTHGDRVLLGLRPAGARFAGLWNGLGGHVEPGEDVKEAARRELREEAGLEVPDLRLAAVLHESDGARASLVFVFVGESEKRELRPPPGLEIAWHPLGPLLGAESGPGPPLVPDVRALLPRCLGSNRTLFSTVLWEGDELVSLRFAEPA